MPQRRLALHILLVGKSSFERRLVRTIMMPMGMVQVSEASNGLEAIACLWTKTYDVLIAEWEALLESESALLALVVQRSREPDTKLPTMALANRPLHSQIRRAASHGIDVVLCKPYSPKALRTRLDWMLDRASRTAAEALLSPELKTAAASHAGASKPGHPLAHTADRGYVSAPVSANP